MRVIWAGLVLLLTQVAPTAAQVRACADPDTTAEWYRVIKRWTTEAPGSWTNDALRLRLLAMQREDQADRVDFGAKWNDTTYARRLLHADSSRAQALAAILDSVGLPTRAMVGAKGADAAMLIAQHNGSLQPRVLALAKALPPGSVSPEALALMEDRVLVSQGLPQIFGSQFSAKAGGLFKLDSVADMSRLAERRNAAGLPPLPLYVCYMEENGMKIDRSSLPPRR